MKSKTLIGIALFVCLGLCLALSVYAHGGSTDGDGGHYDHSTGEYHWHHGKSAHQHEDIDGDGDLDCPYDFEDTTGENSGSSSGSSGGSTYSRPVSPTPYRTPLPRNTPEPSRSPTATYSPKPSETDAPELSSYESVENRGHSEFEVWKLVIIIICIAIIVALLIWVYRVQKTAETYKSKYKYALSESRSRMREMEAKSAKALKDVEHTATATYRNFLSEMEDIHGKGYLFVLAGAPIGHELGEDELPFFAPTEKYKWGKPYTFFTGWEKQGKLKYHTAGCTYGVEPVNALTIYKNRERYVPCRICHPQLPDMRWIYTKSRIQRVANGTGSLYDIHPSIWKYGDVEKLANDLNISVATAYALAEKKHLLQTKQ